MWKACSSTTPTWPTVILQIRPRRLCTFGQQTKYPLAVSMAFPRKPILTKIKTTRRLSPEKRAASCGSVALTTVELAICRGGGRRQLNRREISPKSFSGHFRKKKNEFFFSKFGHFWGVGATEQCPKMKVSQNLGEFL